MRQIKNNRGNGPGKERRESEKPMGHPSIKSATPCPSGKEGETEDKRTEKEVQE